MMGRRAVAQRHDQVRRWRWDEAFEEGSEGVGMRLIGSGSAATAIVQAVLASFGVDERQRPATAARTSVSL